MNKNLKPKILELFSKGKTYNEIKQELNCSRGTIAYHCSQSVRLKTHKRQSDHRTKFIRIAKIERGGKCSICGYDKCLAALDFHHVDPSTKTKTKEYDSINSVFRLKGRIAATEELTKCILICANCHREIHDNSGS